MPERHTLEVSLTADLCQGERSNRLELFEVEEKGDVNPTAVGLNMVKCAVGAGSFTFPFALTQTGSVCGIIGIIVFSVMAALTMKLLADSEKFFVVRKAKARSAQFIPSGAPKIPRLTLPGVIRAAFPNAILFGRNIAVGSIYVLVVLTSMGIAIAYTLFITSTLTHAFDVSTNFVLSFLTIPVVILSMMQSFQSLAFTSILGDVAVTAGLVGTIWGGLAAGRTASWPSNVPLFNYAAGGDVPRGLATLSFMFNIQMVCLPMAQSLKDDLARPKIFRRVVDVSYAFIASLNMGFAIVCLLIFHDDQDGIQNPIIKNLNTGAPLQAIRVLLCLDLLFTVPMLLAVGREVLENSVLSLLGSELHRKRDTMSKQADSKGLIERLSNENDVEIPEDDLGLERPLGESKTSLFFFMNREDTKADLLIRLLVRLVLVGLIISLSFGAISNSGVNQAFTDVVALIGGFSGAILGLILPPILYSRASPIRLTFFQIISFSIVVLIGFGLLCSTTYYTIEDMVVGNKNT
ncbi:hypothetical protein AAMO2058_001670900 [Amorphochlora amoebiformis]